MFSFRNAKVHSAYTSEKKPILFDIKIFEVFS